MMMMMMVIDDNDDDHHDFRASRSPPTVHGERALVAPPPVLRRALPPEHAAHVLPVFLPLSSCSLPPSKFYPSSYHHHPSLYPSSCSSHHLDSKVVPFLSALLSSTFQRISIAWLPSKSPLLPHSNGGDYLFYCRVYRLCR